MDATAPPAQSGPTMDSAECAQLLRCTISQVEELARAGGLPAVKIGRGWLFIRDDLLAFLAEQGRAEAAERRAQRQRPGPIAPAASRRRRVPPPLPPLPGR